MAFPQAMHDKKLPYYKGISFHLILLDWGAPVCENLTIFKKSFILTKSHLFSFSPSLSLGHFQVAASLCFKVRLSAKP